MPPTPESKAIRRENNPNGWKEKQSWQVNTKDGKQTILNQIQKGSNGQLQVLDWTVSFGGWGDNV